MALLWLLAGCASQTPAPVINRAAPVAPWTATPTTPVAASIPPPEYYLVKKGDTLYSVALEHGQSYRDLAAWNNLDNPNKIQIGQQLRVRMSGPDAASPVAVVKPVAVPATVEARQLGGSSSPAADTETMKRTPKGGKLPYSEEALAMLQKPDPTPVIELTPQIKPAPPIDRPASALGGDETMEWSWPTTGKPIDNFVEGGNKGIDIAGKVGDPVLAAASGKVILVSSALRGYGNFVIIKHNPAYLSVYAHNSRNLVKEEQMVAKGQKIAEVGSSDSDQPKLHFEIRHQGKPVDPAKFLPAR